MVHRDIKPHNLMLTPGGRVKILDFGLSRFATEATSGAAVTAAGMVMGTVDYIAPEQADNAHQADIRSDIYSLGCTLYHLLAGQVPFPAGTPIQKVMAHVEKTAQPLTELRHDLPGELMAVVGRMLAKKPDNRYQTPAEVALALEPFTLATDSAARPGLQPLAQNTDGRTAVLERKPERVSRRRKVVIATAITTCITAVLLAGGIYRIATDKGELVIQTDNDDAEVTVKKNGEVVKIIDTKTGKHLTLNSGEYDLTLQGDPNGLSLSPDKMTIKRGETVLATITHDINSEKIGLVRRFLGHKDAVRCLTFSSDGRYLLSASGNEYHMPQESLPPGRDCTVRLWDVRTGQQLHSYEGHGREVLSAAISDDSRLVISGGWDATARVWDPVGEHQTHTLEHPVGVRCVALSSDGRYALSAGGWKEAGCEIRLWDARTWKASHPLEGHTESVRQAVFSLDGGLVLSGAYDGSIRLWDIGSGKDLQRFVGTHAGRVTSVALSPDNQLAYSSSSEDGEISVWYVSTGKLIRKLEVPKQSIHLGTAFSRDCCRALSAGQDGIVHLWDTETARELTRFNGHRAEVWSLALSADDRYAASGEKDGTIRLWRLPDPPPPEKIGLVRRFEGHNGPVSEVAFSPDGRYILSGSGFPDGDMTLRLWDAKSGEEIRRFEGHAAKSAVLPTHRTVVSCCREAGIRRFDSGTLKQ
jgi:WD40 repeat protein